MQEEEEEEYASKPSKGVSHAPSGKKRPGAKPKASKSSQPAAKKPKRTGKIDVIEPDAKLLWEPDDNSQHDATYKLSKNLAPRGIPTSKGIIYKCKSLCGDRCWYINPSTHNHCRRTPCVDYRYCPQHLMSEKHLLVGKYSRHLRSLNPPVDGRGLYAIANAATLKQRGMTDDIPNIYKRAIIFKKGDLIDYYGGEYMSKKENDARYVNAKTGTTYSVGEIDGGANVMDAFCASTAGAYANDPYDPRNQDPFAKARTDANIEVRSKKGSRNFPIYALKDISHGEELLYHYGEDYWSDSE
jgi:hypothetical protein